MANVSAKTRRWFEIGHRAFSRTFPQANEVMGGEPFYVCPLCLRSFNTTALEGNWLTQEDVPPKSVGGRRIVLTCAECNHFAGAEMDDDYRRELDLLSFISGKGHITNRRASLKTSSGQVPIRLHRTDGGFQMYAQPHAAPPGVGDAVQNDFAAAQVGDEWKRFKFNVSLEPFFPARAEASALRSAYLAFFAALGYRFALRQELDVVRQRLRNPNTRSIVCRVAMPSPIDTPSLVFVKAPRRCFAMLYRFHAVVLPMYGDFELYEHMRAEATKSEHGTMTGSGIFEWPTKPVFRHDELDSLAVNPAPPLVPRHLEIDAKPHATKRGRRRPKAHQRDRS